MSLNEQDRPQNMRRRPGRAPTSCAECRRLKLKCDKKIPCESCLKRGCEVICPSGTLTAGKGSRLVLANTPQLHEHIRRLSARVRELEDALKTLQEKVSSQKHPLLHEDLLQLKNVSFTHHGSRPQNSSSQPSSDPSTASSTPPLPSIPSVTTLSDASNAEEQLADSFGTLRIGPCGETTFLGQSSRSEYLVNIPNALTTCADVSLPRLSPRLLNAGMIGMDKPFNDPLLKEEVFSMLPSLPEAIRLCTIYLETGQYTWSPLLREELLDDHLLAVYSARSVNELKNLHSLALLFIVFALAAHQDPSQPPNSSESQEYSVLAWCSWHFLPPLSHLTLVSVQVMIHFAHYSGSSDTELKGISTSWMFLGLAVSMAHSIGLHLNSARWKLDKTTNDRRNRVFWQLFVLDNWLSFSFGRPPFMTLNYVDCAMAEDPTEVTHEDGSREMGYTTWTWQYTRLIMHPLIATAFSAKRPPYGTILELDRKVRDFPVPQHLRPVCDKKVDPALAVQRWNVLTCKEWTLLNLHRPYFSCALRELPLDLLKHKYGPSVMATYRSAWRIIEAIVIPVKDAAQEIERIGRIWSMALSAAIVMCILVTRSPCSSLTTSALKELDTITEAFEASAARSPGAAHNLDTIRKLQRKARESVGCPPSDTTSLTPDELDRFGGGTHFVSSEQTPPTQLSAEEALHLAPHFVAGIDHLHPTIAQDMRMFDGLDVHMTNYNARFDFPYPQQVPPGFQFPGANALGVDNPQGDWEPSFAPEWPEGDAIHSNTTYGSDPAVDVNWQNIMEELGL